MDDVVGLHRNVLYPGASVVVHELLYLAAASPARWLVDRHLDRLLVVSDDNRPQRRVLGVHRLVVHRPETVKHQHTLVPAQVADKGKRTLKGWLGSNRVVSVLDSGTVGPGFKSPPQRCRVTVKLFTPIVPLFTKQR